MLQTQTVEPHTFSVLKGLMNIPQLEGFSLVGGTALSLLYGHRTSLDLDLFSTQSFENENIINALITLFRNGLLMEDKPKHFGIFCYINNVKVDLVRHPHPIIRPIRELDGIRLFSDEDIIAMKVQAILGRARKKDFWDIAMLLEQYTVEDFVRWHREKYSTQNLLITVPQAITYFSEAEEDENPRSLKGQTWESVKESIQEKVRAYLK